MSWSSAERPKASPAITTPELDRPMAPDRERAGARRASTHWSSESTASTRRRGVSPDRAPACRPVGADGRDVGTRSPPPASTSGSLAARARHRRPGARHGLDRPLPATRTLAARDAGRSSTHAAARSGSRPHTRTCVNPGRTSATRPPAGAPDAGPDHRDVRRRAERARPRPRLRRTGSLIVTYPLSSRIAAGEPSRVEDHHEAVDRGSDRVRENPLAAFTA